MQGSTLENSPSEISSNGHTRRPVWRRARCIISCFPPIRATDQDTRPPTRLLARVYGRSRTGRKGTERTSSTSTPTPVPWASRHERSSKSAYKNSQQNRNENQPKASRVFWRPQPAGYLSKEPRNQQTN